MRASDVWRRSSHRRYFQWNNFRHNVFVLLVIQHEKRCEYVGNKREIFDQISYHHRARMVSEGRKKHNRGMREIKREQKKKKKAWIGEPNTLKSLCLLYNSQTSTPSLSFFLDQLALSLSPFLILFLDASSHLYKRVCPSIGWSVGRSVGQSVGPSVCLSFTLLVTLL